MKFVNIISGYHLRTKRNYLDRMQNDKIGSMKIARRYDKFYWDSSRKTGYGGYKYIKDYWKPAAKKIIRKYKLSNSSKIIDIGCGKGFLIFEIKKILPKIKILGLDISKYAIKSAKPEIRKFIKFHDVRNKLKYKNSSFDLAISLGCLHNLEIQELFQSIKEISRISKKQYIMVESYRNIKELFNLQCWALTANSFFSKKEWSWIFKKKLNYKGDLELIYFS